MQEHYSGVTVAQTQIVHSCTFDDLDIALSAAAVLDYIKFSAELSLALAPYSTFNMPNLANDGANLANFKETLNTLNSDDPQSNLRVGAPRYDRKDGVATSGVDRGTSSCLKLQLKV